MFGGYIDRALCSGGGSQIIVSNMVDLIDKMPTLYTFTAGEYSFEFKIDTDPISYEYATGYDADSTSVLNTVACIYYVCKNGSKIICAKGEQIYYNGPSLVLRFNKNGDVVYYVKFSDVQISEISVIYNSGSPDFKVNAIITTEYGNNEGFIGSTPNYLNGVIVSTVGNQPYSHFFSTLPKADFAVAYANAVEELKNSVST